MKYILRILCSFLIGTFLGCSKKNLPEPNSLNNSKKTTQNVTYQPLIAPCDSILENNKISYTVNLDGTTMYFKPDLSNHFDYLEITCRDYSTYNNVRIKLPIKGKFVGKVKYDIKNYSDPSSTIATISHSYNNFNEFYYAGYEGSIYAEYTKTQIILTFCDVKVKNYNSSIHEITGKVIVPYVNTY